MEHYFLLEKITERQTMIITWVLERHFLENEQSDPVTLKNTINSLLPMSNCQRAFKHKIDFGKPVSAT